MAYSRLFVPSNKMVLEPNVSPHKQIIKDDDVNPKRAGGGAESAPLRHFLLYLCRLLFFRAETSWLFSFKPCALFL